MLNEGYFIVHSKLTEDFHLNQSPIQFSSIQCESITGPVVTRLKWAVCFKLAAK